MSRNGFLRVYFADEAWTTVPVNSATKASTVVAIIAKKKYVEPALHGLYVSDSNIDVVQNERLLGPGELPLEIQETVRKHGQLDHFKFTFKKTGEETGGDSSDEEQAEQQQQQKRDREKTLVRASSSLGATCFGYLSKLGARHKAWRERWFVLQGDKLFYFKSHHSASSISYIKVSDAYVKPCLEDDGRPSKYIFQIDTKDRLYFLKSKTSREMTHWINMLQRNTGEEEDVSLDSIQRWMEDVEHFKAESDEKALAVIGTLPGTLHNNVALSEFMSYVFEKHCEENLLFWCDAEDYRTTARGSDERKERAQVIFKKFVRAGAPSEIFIDDETRKLIAKKVELDDPEQSAFQTAQALTYQQLVSASFPNFLDSRFYQKALLSMPTTNWASLQTSDAIDYSKHAEYRWPPK